MNDETVNLRRLLITAGVVLTLFIGYCSMTIIPTGYVGVPALFGKTYDYTLSSGLHFLNPLTRVTKMDTRTQKLDETGLVPTKEMLTMQLDTTVNFHLDPKKAMTVFSEVGADYVEKIVDPHVRSTIRQVAGNYTADRFFSSDRNLITKQIFEQLDAELSKKGVILESIMLKEITPPQQLKAAIENKQVQQQEAEAMQFRLQRERLEAERKQIEAEGIQKFQEIVKQGIDENLLTWKGIEATEALAKSPNTKIIIFGNPKNGLPVILGGEK